MANKVTLIRFRGGDQHNRPPPDPPWSHRNFARELYTHASENTGFAVTR